MTMNPIYNGTLKDFGSNDDQGTAESLYSKLTVEREPFLRRGRKCAKYTIPSLLPPEGHNQHENFDTPYQGVGARGVNNLTSKLSLTLFPPNTPFLRYMFDEKTLVELEQENEEVRAKLDEALARRERAITKFIEMSGDRVHLNLTLKHLLVTGNALPYVPMKGKMSVFPLDRYVCKRDGEGNVLHIITKETLSPIALPDKIKPIVLAKTDMESQDGNHKNCEIYTHIYKEESGNHKSYQEVKGVRVPDSEGTYPADKLPWLALRNIEVPGEDYGRSYVEEYLGDLINLEGLEKSINEGSSASAKMLFMVAPGTATKKSDVAKAKNCDVITGRADDVTVLQAQKHHDLAVGERRAASIEERLAHAFLLNTSIQRNAERVTAEEIRYMAGELETILGGQYTMYSNEVQLPYANLKIARMEKEGRLDSLPKDIVKPVVVTGMEALGRGNDLNQLNGFLAQLTQLAQVVGPEQIAMRINLADLITRMGTGHGIDLKGLINSEQKIQMMQQEQQQQAQQQAMQESMMNQAGPVITKSMEMQQQQNVA